MDILAHFLQRTLPGKTRQRLESKNTVFFQGSRTEGVYFVEDGTIKLGFTSDKGREFVIAILGPEDLLGEACLLQDRTLTSATTLEPASLVRIEPTAILEALAEEPQLAEAFIKALVFRIRNLEGSLIDHMSNNSERRLARILLKLSTVHARSRNGPEVRLPKLTHETLAEMVGTTRPRITQFMSRFRRMGLIEYEREILVRPRLLSEYLVKER